MNLSNTKIIVGLHGKRGVGKDTVADHLVSEYGFTKIAFADSLRECCAKAWDVPVETFTDRETKELDNENLSISMCTDMGFIVYSGEKLLQAGMRYRVAPRSPRWILQNYADYLKKVHGELLFVTMVANKILAAKDPVVVSDVRYDFEADFLLSLHSCIGVLEITRVGFSIEDHSSDQQLPNKFITHRVRNNWRVEDLTTSASFCVADMLRKWKEKSNAEVPAES